MPVARLTEYQPLSNWAQIDYQLLSKTPDNSIRKAISGLPKPLPAVLKYPPAIHNPINYSTTYLPVT